MEAFVVRGTSVGNPVLRLLQSKDNLLLGMTLSRHAGLLGWAPLQDALKGVELTSQLARFSGDGSRVRRWITKKM